jgi:hypothetical protein
VALKFLLNPLSGEFDLVQDLTAIEADIADLRQDLEDLEDSLPLNYLKLDGSNGPITGDLGIQGDLNQIKTVPYDWPAAQGAVGTYLKNDGSGNLVWATVASGGGGGTVFVSALDTTDGYLANKLVATNGAFITLLNPGGNESLQISAPENFSYKKIVAGKTVTIPANQQMLVADEVDVEGTLEIHGELQVIL